MCYPVMPELSRMSTSGRREGVGEVPHLIIVFICCINMAALSFINLVVFVLCFFFFFGGGGGDGAEVKKESAIQANAQSLSRGSSREGSCPLFGGKDVETRLAI